MSGTEKERKEIDVEDLKCGYFTFTPKCLQRFAKPPAMLVCLMVLVFTQGFIVNGIKNINTATLERRFELSSTEVAWISSCYDISAALLAILFGILGAFLHKPRVIAIGAFILGCGSLVTILPHILAGEYEVGTRDVELCTANGTACTENEGSSSSYYYLFIIGQLLHSVGGAATFTLGVPMLDENVRREDSAFYIGCMLSCSVLGPGAGFMLGGYFLSIYVDIGRVDMDDVTITPSDPRWVGAWWIGYAIAACIAITISVFIACFPRTLPVALEYQANRKSEAYKGIGEKETKTDKFGSRPGDIWTMLKTLAHNPVFGFLALAGIAEYFLIGFATFIPKIIQFQMGQTPAMTALILGCCVMPAATMGHIIGGLIPKWMHHKVRGMLGEIVVFNVICAFSMLTFLMRCDMPKIAGISITYDNSTIGQDADNPDLLHPCNVNCSCSTISYDPVCGQNGVTYFTPCHAGCLIANETTSPDTYSNCSCISMETQLDPFIPDAEAGVCPMECNLLPYFIIFFLSVNFTTFAPATIGSALVVRIVPDKQRAFAYAVMNTITRIFGQVPGPLVFGAIFDNSCWLWQDICDSRGSCWIYNVDETAVGISMLAFSMKLISGIATSCALYLYKPPPPEVEEKEINVDDSNSLENQKTSDHDKSHHEIQKSDDEYDKNNTIIQNPDDRENSSHDIPKTDETQGNDNKTLVKNGNQNNGFIAHDIETTQM